MQLDKYLGEMYKTSEQYEVPVNLIYSLVEAQDNKKVRLGKESDLEHALEIVNRYFKIKTGN